MIQAYFIEDVRGLSDLFKVNLAPKKSAHHQFKAYRVRHPSKAGKQALVLTGVQRPALVEDQIPEAIGREINVLAQTKEGVEQLYWYDDKGKKLPFVLYDVQRASHLYELISPVAWRHEPEEVPMALFWLEDHAMMPALVRRSLYLGNDRIRVANLKLQDNEGQAKDVTLVRMESPSYYLIAWALERVQTGALKLYAPFEGSGALFTEWGTVHPLQTLWERVWAREDTQNLIFFPRDGHFNVVEPPQWQDLYDIVDFSFDLGEQDAWAPGLKEAEKFQVPLSLKLRHEPFPCELVLLRESEQQNIEDFLALSQEEQIAKLEISVQKDSEGERWFLIRERNRGRDTSLLTEFGGVQMSRYKGFDNLYLPTMFVLEPTVRRDQYRELFSLQPNLLTLLVKEGDEGETRHVRVQQRSFEPLKNFVQHVVLFEHEALQKVIEQSIFDLKTYSQSLSRPDLLGAQERKEKAAKETKPKATAKSGDQKKRSSRLDARLQAAKQRQARRRALRAQENEGEESPEAAPKELNELQLLERDLERDLILHGVSSPRWFDLAQVKQDLKKHHEATLCQIESIWTAQFPPSPTENREPEIGQNATQELLKVMEAKNWKPEPVALASRIIIETQQNMDGSPAAIATLMERAVALRHVEEHLNKKMRWLAWRAILGETKDVRTQEDVRGQLLESLNTKGLTPEDALPFIRERILTDPDIEFDDDALEQSSDRGFLLQNIETIEKQIHDLQTTKIRYATFASLARIYSVLGMHNRAKSLLDQALMGIIEKEDAPAGDSVYGRIEELFVKNKGKKPEHWHLWVMLNAMRVCTKTKPEDLNQVTALYENMKKGISDYNRSELVKIEKSLEERAGKSKVAEFLSLDARPFFSSKALPQQFQNVINGLNRGLADETQSQNLGRYVSDGINIAIEQIRTSSSLEDVARLIMEMVNILRRMRWDRESKPVAQFKEFINALSLDAAPNASRLYFAILHCAGARALMDLGDERAAMERLSEVLKWVGGEFMQVIDFADLIMNEVLLTFEMAPRNYRQSALKTLMEVLIEQEKHERGPDPSKPGQGFEISFQAFQIIQMLDHTLEAAIGNEKLVQRRLRDYEEREEARLRYWLQRDQPAS